MGGKQMLKAFLIKGIGHSEHMKVSSKQQMAAPC